jgi:hypothetical protein
MLARLALAAAKAAAFRNYFASLPKLLNADAFDRIAASAFGWAFRAFIAAGWLAKALSKAALA